MILGDGDYCGLHTHFGYSLLDGYGTTEQVTSRIKELGQMGCGITDHGSLFGLVDFDTAMRAAGLHPVLGCEFYHSKSVVKETGKETGDKQKSAAESMSIPHLTVLAKDQVGYRNLLKLYDLSYREGFWRKPRIDWEMLLKHSSGLTVLSGCYLSILSRLVRDGQHEEAHRYCDYLRREIDFYIEIVPCPDFGESIPVVQTLWRIAQDLKIPVVITDDAHFPRPGDHATQDAMFCLNLGKTLHDPTRKHKLPPYHYRCTAQEIYERARRVLPESATDEEVAAACRRSVEIARACQVEVPRTSGPVYPVPKDVNPAEIFGRWIKEGVEERAALGLTPTYGTPAWVEYDQRLKYELQIIADKGFLNYFLIVSDIVRWMRKEKILAIARGSCGGSLVCYFLGITQIDPVRWGLPFERFLNPERRDMPDIDIDIDSRFRDRVVEYVMEMYGRDRCAQIATLNEFGARQALLDICKVAKVPDTVREELKRLLPEGMEEGSGLKARGVLKRLFEKNARAQTLLKAHPALKLAADLEGQIRQVSVHAAGVVIDREPLIDSVPIATFPDRMPLVACDKEHAANIGLLKIDLLSVDMLSVMAEVLEELGREPYDVCSIPLDREVVYAMLSEGRSEGVFQAQGHTTQRVLRDLKPTEFNDLIALMALARPGPLESGGTDEYIDRKHGRRPMPNYHPIAMNILKDTYGVIIYQEQVMSIMREIGGMSWGEVHKVRKIISKSQGAEKMNAYREPYLKHAAAIGIPVEEAERLFRMCVTAGEYLFNKAHGAIYAMDAYWSAYLKVNFPALYVERFARYANDEKKRGLFRDFAAHGGRFRLLDYKHSGASFCVLDERTILGGWVNIAGVGLVEAQKMVEKRETFTSWLDALRHLPANVGKALFDAGIHTDHPDPDALLTLAPWYVSVDYLPVEAEVFAKCQCHTIEAVQEWMAKGESRPFRVVGRVTGAEQKGKKRTMFLSLADPTGTIDVWIARWKWEDILMSQDPLRGPTEGIGNSVLLLGNLSDDGSRAFGDGLHHIRTCQGYTPDPDVKVRRVNPDTDDVEDLKGLQQQLRMDLEMDLQK